ncbi:hypothetical protein CON48_21915 [Bacillus thuringiensis]|uniref:EsaC-like protein n=1 Tax=Bacillus thuringiensis TaxID=1428 RepID=A0A9X6V4Q4_BACTU|nr:MULTISPECIES: hypothetical protein [Bacillus]AJQ59921.1 EsaC-like protein [Bacillus thuringiensis serovar morrisoni]AMR85714.1 hypothetical protein A3L20_17355 [Bacillus thuringiensis]EOO08900.1 hypothetical protein IAW_01694 [Bacillus cereus str. Schrouff]EOO87433.1 hypothetical protein IGY_02312 [Bacillus cereus K-5975c]KIP28751.1 hypothetical protein BG10_6793 [Bacillus thuringiensis serovar morrisoni]
MLDELYNAFLNASGFTESARKRDRYDDLHDYLKDKERELKQFIQEAESAKREYESKSNGLEANKIPAVEFEQKRHEKDEDLNTVLSYFKSALSDIGSAKSTAYAKYLEYKAKAESEKASAYAAATKSFEEKKKEFENFIH